MCKTTQKIILSLLCLFLVISASACSTKTVDAEETTNAIDSSATIEEREEITRADPIDTRYYIGNRSTKKYHLPSCSFLPNPENQVILFSKEEAENQGYSPCKKCHP